MTIGPLGESVSATLFFRGFFVQFALVVGRWLCNCWDSLLFVKSEMVTKGEEALFHRKKTGHY